MSTENKSNPFEKSGATFERKIAEKFELAGWIVQTKQHYIDPFEEKPREIDIIATKHIVIGDNSHQTMWGFIPIDYEMKIFLECKYLQELKGLFVRKSNHEKDIKAFLDLKVYKNLCEDYYNRYGRISDIYSEHRYLSSEYVIYDSTDNNDRGFGMPAIKQIIHGLMSKTHRSPHHYSIQYPVIITNSSDNIINRYDNIDEDSAFISPLLFEFDYVDKNEKKMNFLVDVLTLEYLDDFIRDRDLEFAAIRKYIFEDESFRQDTERR